MGIAIAIPTYEREDMTFGAFAEVYNDPRVDEIVIVDDASTSMHGLLARAALYPKVRAFCNEKNLGCYQNKRRAVEQACTEWVVLFDSDNVMAVEYLQALWNVRPWNPDILYAPTYGRPMLDYRIYERMLCTQFNVAQFLDDRIFTMALNTGNFFVHRDSYLSVREYDDIDPLAADSLYFVSQWLASGKQVLFTPGLSYEHRIHEGLWMQQAEQSTVIAQKVIQHMRMN